MMDLDAIGVEFRRIDRSWSAHPLAGKQAALARLRQLEAEVPGGYAGGSSTEAIDLVRAIRMLHRKIEHAVDVDRRSGRTVGDSSAGWRRRLSDLDLGIADI
jgi:hypothetical protein